MSWPGLPGSAEGRLLQLWCPVPSCGWEEEADWGSVRNSRQSPEGWGLESLGPMLGEPGPGRVVPLIEDDTGIGRPLQWGLALPTVTSFLRGSRAA